MTLTVQNIEKSYDRPVLKGVSHTFAGGGLYVIKGVSGCGKSTLFHILGGIETSFSGQISLDGESLEGRPDRLRELSGTVYQHSLLLSGLTVGENLLFIKNDPDRAEALCRELGVSELLDRLPEELSGGERQRVSLARALLRSPRILLVDEPTASLDKDNSAKIAELLARLRAEDRIILVATHERCFDELADEIIDLRYGQIASVRTFARPPAAPRGGKSPATAASREARPVGAFTYALKRGKGGLRLPALLPFALIFLVLLLLSTVQNRLSAEWVRFIEEDYPVDAFNLEAADFAALPEPRKSRLRVYEEYRASEGDVRAFYLADREDSVLAIKGMLEFGRFPEAPDQILVSHEYAESKLGGASRERVGERMTFLGRTFTVSGILYEIDWSLDDKKAGDGRNRDFHYYLGEDGYYRANPGVFHDRAAYNALRDVCQEAPAVPGASVNRFVLNVFDQKIGHAQELVDGVTSVLYGVLAASFLVVCVFVSSQIQIELFYRRRELGFLQIFGVEKRRVQKTVLAGYALRLLFSLLLSLALYGALWAAYLAVTGHAVIFNPLHIAALTALIALFYLLSVYASTAGFLKKSVMELITG